MSEPAITPDPFDGGCPADTAPAIINAKTADIEKECGHIYAVISVYRYGIEPTLIQCHSLSEAIELARAQQNRHVIKIPVPRVA